MKTRNLKLIPALILALTLIIGCVLPITAAASSGATVTFATPKDIDAPLAQSVDVALPTATAPDGYTFVGWTTAPVEETTEKPVTVYLAGETVTADHSITLHALYSKPETVDQWVLVTDASTLAVGDQIIIAAKDYNVAMSTTQNDNNRGQTTITKDGKYATFGNDVQVITLETGNVDNTFAFNTGSGYLYAASSSSNNLKTKNTLDNNGSWLISITDGSASIVASGNNTRNTLKYNLSSSLFSCYATKNSQKDICIYVKGFDTVLTYTTLSCSHDYEGVETKPATCTETGIMTYTCTKCDDAYTDTLPVDPDNHSFDNGKYCSYCYVSNPAVDLSGRYYIAGAKGDGPAYYVCGNTGTNDSGSTVFYNIYDSGFSSAEIPESIAAPDRLFTFVLVKDAETNTYKIYAESVSGDENYMGSTKQDTGKFVNEASAFSVKVIYTNDGNQVNLKTVNNNKILGVNTASNALRACWYNLDTTLTTNLNLIPVEDQPAQFTGASLDITSDLSLLYHVKLEEGETIGDYSVRFKHGNNDIIESIPTSDGEEGYTFYYTGITPQRMGDIVKAELLKNGEAVAVKTEFSVKHYVEAYKAQYGTDEISVFLDKILVYGAAAQAYTGYNTENLVTEVVLPNEKFNEEYNARDTSRNTDKDYKFTAAGLRFDYVNKFFVKFKAESLDGVSVQFGEDDIVTEFDEIGEGEYIAYSSELFLTCFSEEIRITISVNDVERSSIVYSGFSYLIAKWNSEGDFGVLVKALYFCADAASSV